MTLTKNAIGNLANRYKAVLKKCNLMNMFGTLAVAAMLVLGSAGMAMADSGINWVRRDDTWLNAHNPDPTYREWHRHPVSAVAGVYADRDAVSGNVVITSHDFGHDIYGGYAKQRNANNNSVTINGYLNGKNVYGGYANRDNANGNSVTINAEARNCSFYGGYIRSEGYANDNSVTINASNSSNHIYGGYSNTGSAMNNHVTLGKHGSRMRVAGVFGGWGWSSPLTNPLLYSGNTLTVKGTTRAQAVANFEYYNFDIPGGLKSGDRVLFVAGSKSIKDSHGINTIDFGIDAEVRSVNVYGTRKVGDTFILVHAPRYPMEGTLSLGTDVINNTTPRQGHSETVDGIFEYELYFDSADAARKNLFAKITKVLDLKGDEFPNVLDGTLSEMFVNAYDSGEVVSSFADDPFMPEGVRFLARAINEHYGNSSNEAAKTVESVAQVAAVAAVPQMALGANLAGVSAIGQRTTIGQPTSSLQSVVADNVSGLNGGDELSGLSAGGGYDKSGFAMWIMPLWQSNNNFGVKAGDFEMDSHASIGGIAIGADYTIEQAVRLGLTFNIGGGYAEGSGDLAKTKNNMNFWGVGAYAGWMSNNFGLAADVNYTSTHNDIKQEIDPSFAMQDMKAEVMATALSAGLRAEYKFNTEALDIIPHVGVRYMYLTTYGYDVESAGETVLEADAVSQNIWTFPIGVQFAKSFDMDNGWYVRPSLDLNVTPAAGDIEVKREVRFTGVTASAKPETQVMDYITYGGQAGLEFGNDNVKLGMNYNLQLGALTTNHGVFGTLRYELLNSNKHKKDMVRVRNWPYPVFCRRPGVRRSFT